MPRMLLYTALKIYGQIRFDSHTDCLSDYSDTHCKEFKHLPFQETNGTDDRGVVIGFRFLRNGTGF